MTVLYRICVLALLAAGGYWFWTREAPPDRSPEARLERFLQGPLGDILGPLDRGMPQHAVHELRTLRDNFEHISGEHREKSAWAMSAAHLCKTVLSCLQDRENALRRLAAAESGKYSNLHQGVHKEIKKREQTAAFVAGVNRSWENDARRLRAKVDREISFMRSQESKMKQLLVVTADPSP
jgi:hypothetical protein